MLKWYSEIIIISSILIYLFVYLSKYRNGQLNSSSSILTNLSVYLAIIDHVINLKNLGCGTISNKTYY